MTILFTSDTHFFHRKMLEFRGFDTLEAMHDHMVKAWNELVSPSDTVYHLGDLSFGKALETADIIWRLNGQIRLIPGNHDNSKFLRDLYGLVHDQSGLTPKHWDRKPKLFIENQLTEIKLIENRSGGDVIHPVVLCHFPLLVWNKAHYGAIHLHGHSHGLGRYPDNNRRFDVGVDAVGYGPLSAAYVIQWAKARGFTAHDQHTEKTDDSSQGHSEVAP